MKSLILGAERLPEEIRSAINEVASDHAGTLVVVVADGGRPPADLAGDVVAARERYPEAWVLAVTTDAAFSAAFDAGVHDVVRLDATPAEVKARLRSLNRERERTLPDRPRSAEQAGRLITLGTAATGLAHDFNNLLTVIVGHTAFLKDDTSLDASSQKSLRALERAAVRAGQLTEQILRYAGTTAEPPHPVDLNALVRDTAAVLRSLASPRADVRLSLADEHLEVQGDESGLMQLLMNLIQNAADASSDARSAVVVRTGSQVIDPSLAIRLDPPSTLSGRSAVFLEVEDHGTGISPTIASQIFEPFFSTRGHNRGLGLSVVREVVRLHGGAIELDTEPTRGTLIRVWLPRMKPPVEAAATSERPVSTERWASRGVVLVADDEPEVRGLLRRVFVTSGFQVLEAEDGQATLELVEAHPNARLLMLDLTMPRLDGAEVARRLTAAGREIPVVIMSGYTFAQAKARMTSLEVAGFLKKPFLPGAVIAKVQRVLGD